ncbi:hypothetical protein BDV95DRAFT_619840 [Massariosphaeria phaeospora]|uniref:Uncharacterized protein n=1 Tax=Massariosphaeria phaeospora TaxID=100035 RepID=A0A7C8M8Y6_9PLEO|nr:hypothetical protein BDV95DRAFT_619840 [Massariosphaeria phaeospora]
MAKAWERVEKRAISTIQAGERDEVNPWVDRTQWLPYLVGIERADLLACIKEPVAEPDPRSDNEAEPTRYQPLQPYIDKEAIVKHTRPWQQVLMFFARTQKEHAWKSSQYRFKRQQREA